MKKKRIASKILWVLSILTLIFLWAPMILIIVFSFSSNKYGSSWEGFTLKWYVKLFTNDQVRDALMRSLIIAGVTVVVATLIGTITAYGLYKLNFKGKQFLRTSILLPIV
ncbi:MAG: spermidine/putrescine ABC transporter permease, partial [bacterium]|nr:spermidine/putrescine ABC transporter permease [bacterium]